MDCHIPAKKARFDCLNMPETSRGCCNDNSVEDGPVEDLWAGNEFTAEEFDLLQSQVTSQAFNVENLHNMDPMMNEFQKLKEVNYGLEGKIKMLRSTLEKNTQELEKERLEKMNLMEKYSEEQKQQQKSFEKEKERIETHLQFKEQELQTAFGKIAILEQKDKCTLRTNKMHIKNSASDRAADISKDFICGTSGNKSIAEKSNAMVQTERKEQKLSNRLKLWCNKTCSAVDLVTSNMLCRAGNLFFSTDVIINEEKILQRNTECTSNALLPLYSAHTKIHTNFTRIALSKLNLERENRFTKDSVFPDKLPSFQILHLLEQGLKECLNVLKGIMNGGQQQTPNLSWSSILYKDKDWFRLNILLNSEKLPLSPVVIEEIFSLVERQQVMTFQYLYHLLSLEAVRNILFSSTKEKKALEKIELKCNEKSEISEKFVHPLIDDVLTASTPLFYEGKCINKSAVEWSLAVLIKLAEYNGERFDSYLPDISVCGITSGKCSLMSSFLLLHLLQYLLPFEFLTNHIGRHSSLCIYHSLFELCERISMKDMGAFEMKIMTLVLNLLSGLLSNHNILDATVDCHCIHKLFDIIMKILNTEIRLYTYKQSDNHSYFLQNGMSSLNWLRQLSIFQDQFTNSQPMYVSLWNDSSLHLNSHLCNESLGNFGCISIVAIQKQNEESN